jgi:hypothetical protein
MGGNVPLGYDVKDRKLVVNEPEEATVRLIFRRYLGSVALLRAELDRLGIVSKRRGGAGGRLAGGKQFSRGALYLMLQNRIYRGDIVHQGTAYPGQHEAIIDPELWQIVQDKLAAHRQGGRQRRPRRTDQRSFRDPKPVPLRIGRQHRGNERTTRNEQVPANLPHSTFSPRAGNCRRSTRRSTSH